MHDRITRRQMFTRTAEAMATILVAQVPFAGCASDRVATTSSGCELTAALTEGPFFVDERLNRSDIRSDPTTGALSDGAALDLAFTVMRNVNGTCSPLTGAYVDVWHCDADGVYSDVGGAGAGERFLRGYQITDGAGAARFTTIYPGWYAGRAVHVHFKVRLFAGSTASYEFTSQLFFDEAVTSAAHALAPYSARGTRDTLNADDGIYNGLSSAEKSVLTLRPAQSASGYAGALELVVRTT